jgi:hypothetical protein
MPSPVRTNTLAFAIAGGASLSDAQQLNGLFVEHIDMPGTWSAAGLSFAVSETEAGTYVPLVDALGVEITLTVAASQRVMLPLGTVRGHAWIKLRSGTSAAVVTQGGARTLTALCRDYA